MKGFALAIALVTPMIAGTAAHAQNAPVYRYCLEQRFGFLDTATLCRFNTLAQCVASKTGPADFCYLNPAYRGSRR